MRMELIVWVMATGYTALVGAIAYAVYQLKLISVILDNQPKIIDNDKFLKNYSLQIKANKFLEKIWPRVKRAKLSGVSRVAYKVVNILFVVLLLLQFLFSDFLSPAAPAIFLSLGFFAAIGNALQDKKRTAEAKKYILLPFSLLFPLFVAYHIDTSEKLLKIKSVLTAQPLEYEATLASLTIGLGLFCYFGLNIIERFERVVVSWILSRALILSQNMVLVGVNPTMPEEKEMRAIAKEAIVVTAKNMVIFGLVISTLACCTRYIIEHL
ncbi:hypothetical protein LOY37_12995 [Pseudomonas sp. B21-012]|uniref:hypothetical protein n=1 Tax=Pseudomonas sp. B21-012 TaxID=2895472 RepID=UPI00215F9BF5|nr:hypothetical protein [Pseudomonas sp. B21-012]UVM58460.1 hypothetical protein LOY37_12995 [Pseudomonas sp. B21-012]